MPYKVGVSSGLYTVARAEELSTVLRKLGYALTRGTSVIEVTGDIPHEVDISTGMEMVHMAEKQGIELTFHGSLTVPMAIPERTDWRDADDHMKKSIRSAVFSGCNYCLFHITLNIWLELMTYAGRKLTMVFCDHEGKFISHILKESPKLRKWFAEEKGDIYMRDILNREEITELRSIIQQEEERWRKIQLRDRLSALLNAELPDPIPTHRGPVPRSEFVSGLVERAITTNIPPDTGIPAVNKKIDTLFESIRNEVTQKSVEIEKEKSNKYLMDKFASDDPKKRRWESEELRAIVGIVDGYHIMSHYLFYKKDPIWVAMAEMYRNVLGKYNLDYSNDRWLDEAWRKAEETSDKDFKEFFYAAVAAKFVEGHMKELVRWLDDGKAGLVKEISDLPSSVLGKFGSAEGNRQKLLNAARELKIVLESPDARDPSHAGMFLLWSPRQMYAAVKAIRNNLRTDRIYMTMDFEHVATQGIDPIKDMEEVVRIAPDFGRYVLSVHSNPPNPLHAMNPIELGDVRVYQLLWFLRKTGFGKEGRKGYLIFERGGAKDPFAQSVEVLRLCVQFLEKDVHPDELPLEFFGMKGPTAGDVIRQGQIIRDHAWEPLKDLLEMPEEEWTFLSQAAMKKGKRPEQWKRAEFR